MTTTPGAAIDPNQGHAGGLVSNVHMKHSDLLANVDHLFRKITDLDIYYVRLYRFAGQALPAAENAVKHCTLLVDISAKLFPLQRHSTPEQDETICSYVIRYKEICQEKWHLLKAGTQLPAVLTNITEKHFCDTKAIVQRSMNKGDFGRALDACQELRAMLSTYNSLVPSGDWRFHTSVNRIGQAVVGNEQCCQRVLAKIEEVRDLAQQLSTAGTNSQEHEFGQLASSFLDGFTGLIAAVKEFERLPDDLKAIVTNGSLRLNPYTKKYYEFGKLPIVYNPPA